jgi:hypothetical protein
MCDFKVPHSWGAARQDDMEMIPTTLSQQIFARFDSNEIITI